MQNAGIIHWQHVTLVHQSGFAPIEPIITVPDLAPGERTELTARYPAVEHGTNGLVVDSEWKLFYKGRPSSFGLHLSVNAICIRQLANTNLFVPYRLCIPQINSGR